MAIFVSATNKFAPTITRITSFKEPAGFTGCAGIPAETEEGAAAMASSVTRHLQNPHFEDFQFLVHGIDSLDLGLYIQWNYRWIDIKALLDTKKQDAMISNGVLDQTPHERQFIHLPSGKPPNYRYHLQFAEYHLYLAIAETPGGSPNAYLSINSEALWKYGLPCILETIEVDLHHYGGTIERIQPSRIDLCADYRIPSGLTLPFLENHRVSRAKETTFHLRRDVLETYYVGSPSAPIRLRLYDKGKEIISKGTKYWFTDIWNNDDITDVWRVEFQLRRPALRQFGINNMEELWQKIGGVWLYLTDEWVSLRSQDNNRTARRSVLPWWEHVQRAGNDFGAAVAQRRHTSDSIASVEWYVSHISGCLPSFAARLNINNRDEAITTLIEHIDGYWKQKDYENEFNKRTIRLGQLNSNDGGASNEEC